MSKSFSKEKDDIIDPEQFSTQIDIKTYFDPIIVRKFRKI
jgi:hypothetical protein